MSSRKSIKDNIEISFHGSPIKFMYSLKVFVLVNQKEVCFEIPLKDYKYLITSRWTTLK